MKENEKNMLTKAQEKLKFRQVKIVCDLVNPKTKETLITEERLKLAIESFKDNLIRYAWILHDNDVYTTETLVLENPKLKGKPKNPHFHIVLEFKNQVYYKTLVKRFGVFESYEAIYQYKKSKNYGFLRAVEYLTHEREEEQLVGKTYYKDNLIHSNFDFRNEIIDMNSLLSKYNNLTDDKDMLINRLINNEITLRDIKRDFNQTYTKYFDLFDKANDKRVMNLKTPNHRINYFFGGKGGRIGKTNGAVAYAIHLLSTYFNINVKEKDFDYTKYIFVTNGKGVAFDDYEGQQIIIYDDFRPQDLINEFKSFSTFLRAFNPQGQELNKVIVSKKFSRVKLVNSINIVVCPFLFEEFINQFAELTKIKKHNEKQDKDFVYLEDTKQIRGRFLLQHIFDTEKMYINVNTDMLDFEYTFDKDLAKQKEYKTFAEMCNMPNIFSFLLQECNNNYNSPNFIDGINLIYSNTNVNSKFKNLLLSETEKIKSLELSETDKEKQKIRCNNLITNAFERQRRKKLLDERIAYIKELDFNNELIISNGVLKYKKVVFKDNAVMLLKTTNEPICSYSFYKKYIEGDLPF